MQQTGNNMHQEFMNMTLTMNNMEIKDIKTTVLKASEGKVLRRKSDGYIAGQEIYLGYTYYLNGIKLVEPLLELPEHYEEVDVPEDLLEKYS